MQLEKSSTNRIEVLDGIKGVSLVIVIAYYFMQHLVPGGFIAINVFFFIGGFLNFRYFKKRIMLDQPMNYLEFYRRRFTKLFFPMLFMIVSVTVIILFLSPNNFLNLRNMGISGLLLVNNIYQIFTNQSFFAQSANQSVFSHLWYSSIYAQLILLTPLMIESCYKWHKKTSTAINMLAVITIISMILIGYLQYTGHDHSDINFNTFSRLFAYTFGGILSLALPYNLIPKKIKRATVIKLNLLGVLLLWLCWMMIRYMYGTQPFSFRYGMSIFTLLTGLIVFISIYPETILYKFFNLKIFKNLGKKSYTYYLWFYPITLILPDILKTINRSFWLYLGIGTLLIVIFSELSYYLIESRKINLPFGQDLNIKKAKYQLKFLQNSPGKYRKIKILLGFYSVVFIIGMIGLIVAPQTGSGVTKTLQDLMVQNKKIVELTTTSNETSKIVINNIEGLEQDVKLYANAQNITFFGDSIFLVSAQQLMDVFPKAVVDAAEGRQLYSSVSDIEKLESNNKLAPTVVVMLGTNGAFTKGQIDDFINEIGSERIIYFVLIGTNRAWTQQVNKELYNVAQQYGNVRLIDWAMVANSHTDWLLDEFHPNETGSLELAKLIANELYRLR